MKIPKYIMALATMLVFAACSTDDVFDDTGNEAVKVNAAVGTNSIFTRSNPIGTSEQQTSFNDGDKISLSNGTQTAVYTLNSGAWSTADAPVKWQTKSGTFHAFYPADGTNTFDKGVIKTDQSSLANLVASDYMRQTVDYVSIPDDRSVSLEMQRQTARVVFKIASYKNQFDGKTPTVDHIHVFSPTEISATASTTATEINTYKDGDEFIALVVPTTAKGNDYFASLCVKTSDNDEGVQLKVRGIPAMEAGKSYTYNLEVGKNEVTIAGVTVNDWTTGSTISGGNLALANK